MNVYAITLAFCNAEILKKSVIRFHKTRNKDLPISAHFIVDQKYPLWPDEIEAALDYLRARVPITILRPGRNLGLHGGFNWAMEQINLPDDRDIVIGYDSDSWPTVRGWDMALVRALEGASLGKGREVVWSTLANPRTVYDARKKGFDEATADGYLKLWLNRAAVTNSVCAWRYGWLKSVGFLTEPRAFYGHLEAAMWDKMQHKREHWAIVPDFGESDHLRNMHDREYVAYKWFHSHTQDWKGDFESFIQAGCPGLDHSPTSIP